MPREPKPRRPARKPQAAAATAPGAPEAAATGQPTAPRRSYDPEQRVVAVTGVRGFVGGEVLKRLEEDRRYARIIAFDVRKPDFPLDKTLYFKLDLTLPSADADLAAILEREGVDTFLHAAFLSMPTHASAWAHELEDIGTMHVLNACAEAQVRKFVLSSTTMVYGASALNPNFLSEDHDLRGFPGSRWVSDKVAAERQVARFARENPDTLVSVLRCAPILGPTVENFITRFFSRPVAPVLMGYDPLLQFVHEQDVVDAFKAVIDDDHAGTFNIVGPGVLPYSTILAMMGKFPLPMPAFLARGLSHALWVTQVFDAPPNFLDYLRYLCVADGKKAHESFGFEPRYDIKSIISDFLGVHHGELVSEGARP
jgi:UDP-glucose 4-epimerase